MQSRAALFCVLVSILIVLTWAQEDFISIEGFVKSSSDLTSSKIDMSSVKVELYAVASGSALLKDSTNCASSGYFVFQVYPDESKHDDYELRVVGPGTVFDNVFIILTFL